MKDRKRKVPTNFGPETRFELRPPASAPYRTWVEDELEVLKRRLLSERLEEVWDPDVNTEIRRAANEAAAVAWVTPYPLLVFPSLFEEKSAAGVERAERQEAVLRTSRELLAV